MGQLNYCCYGNRWATCSRCKSCKLLCELILLILFFTGIQRISFGNRVCVYVHKIYEEKFAGCKKSLSWLGHKINKIDRYVYGHDATNSSSDLGWRHHAGYGKTFKQHSKFYACPPNLELSVLSLGTCMKFTPWMQFVNKICNTIITV